jgi:hypothetical protein
VIAGHFGDTDTKTTVASSCCWVTTSKSSARSSNY